MNTVKRPFESADQSKNLTLWLFVLLAAILIHLVLFLIHWEKWLPRREHPAPVEVFNVDPTKLEAIKKQWREKDKGLLINKDPNLKSEIAPPEESRYISDRNIRVKKESRAKETSVTPKPGQSSNTLTESSKQKKSAPQLGNLGLPIPLKSGNSKSSRPPSVGGEQFIKDPLVPEGSETMLNAQESVFYSFYARIYEAIGPVWQSKINEVGNYKRVPQGEYITVVDVVFDRQGNLTGIHFNKHSGVQEFDTAVESAWRKCSKFPNPPAGLINSNGEIHTGWTFSVRVGGSFGYYYLPPERNY